MIRPTQQKSGRRVPTWARALTAGLAATALGVGAVPGSGVLVPAGAGAELLPRTDATTDDTTPTRAAETTAAAHNTVPPSTTVVSPVESAGDAPVNATVSDCTGWPDLEATVTSAVSVDPAGIGVWVIDLADGCSYGFNGSTEFAAASTIKLLALAGLLEEAQNEGRDLTLNERQLATAMMQYSDNDAASTIIDELEWRGESFAELGARWGVPGAQNPTWGLSQVSAAAMADLIARMFDGSTLDEHWQAEAKAFLDLPDPDFSTGWRIAVGYALPTDWYNGSKVGELVVGDSGLNLHGVGLVESPIGHRYAIAVLGSGWNGYGDEGAAIVELDAIGAAISCLLKSGASSTCVTPTS